MNHTRIITARNTPIATTELQRVPQRTDCARVYRDARNKVYTLQMATTDGWREVCVKRYAVPWWFNRMVYTFFRPTKARHALMAAERLQDAGFATPRPHACIERRKGLLFHTAWYVCDNSPLPTLADVIPGASPEERGKLADMLLETFFRLAAKGLYMIDTNLGNFLLERDADGRPQRLWLVDINRMAYGRRITAADILMQLWKSNLPTEEIMRLLPRVAGYFGKKEGEILYEYRKIDLARLRRKRRHKFLKKLIGR